METKQLTRMEAKTCFTGPFFPIKKQNTFADTKTIIKFYDAANETRTLTTEGTAGAQGFQGMVQQTDSLHVIRNLFVSRHVLLTFTTSTPTKRLELPIQAYETHFVQLN